MGNMGRFEHGGDLYEFPDALDFSASLNPLGMPQSVKDALVANVDSFEAYPDPLCRNLVGAIAQHENVSTEHVVVTAGATDAFSRIVRVVKPGRILLPSPCFSGYEEATRGHDAVIVRHFLAYDNDYDMDEGFLDKLDESIDLVFLCNPNNPTGRAIDLEYVRQVCDRALACDAYVVLDECFAVLAGLPSGISLLEEFENLIVVNAFTKTYAMAGLRLGYCVCASELADVLREAGDSWAVSTPAQVAGAAALSETAYVERSQEFVRERRAALSGTLRAMGLNVIPSAANFILFKSERPLYASLLNKGIVVRRCGNFDGLSDSWYRVAVRTKEENTALARALREVLD